ncbi:winged helix-turn-helix domain-containing protein [Streptomyces sp. NPDC005899]|uniref:ArsR/SmtB family transcription factor n=1 Tax=Streptomyces sp. NPDC005899 TaxID=3155716 RepID=UPI0033F3D60F
MESDETYRVLDPDRDPAALKALTHPLRLRLLGLLRQHGPATASELAVRTGESSASTSYHLRVLAAHAFVAEAEHRDGRERRWRSVHAVTAWNNSAMLTTPGGRAALRLSRRRQAEHLLHTVAQHETDVAEGRLGEEWGEHAGIDDMMPRLTPEALGELWETYRAKVAELTARDAADPRAEQVVLLLAGLPLAATSSPSPDAAVPDAAVPATTGPDSPGPGDGGTAPLSATGPDGGGR